MGQTGKPGEHPGQRGRHTVDRHDQAKSDVARENVHTGEGNKLHTANGRDTAHRKTPPRPPRPVPLLAPPHSAPPRPACARAHMYARDSVVCTYTPSAIDSDGHALGWWRAAGSRTFSITRAMSVVDTLKGGSVRGTDGLDVREGGRTRLLLLL